MAFYLNILDFSAKCEGTGRMQKPAVNTQTGVSFSTRAFRAAISKNVEG
jgi:hypothetical protein